MDRHSAVDGRRIFADDDRTEWMHQPFNLSREQFGSDLEDRNQDSVLRVRWARQWVGPGDWAAQRDATPGCAESSLDVICLWIAKRRDSQEGPDGEELKGRWWNKYWELESSRGQFGVDYVAECNGRTIYHREFKTHWMREAQVFLKKGWEPWTLALDRKKMKRRKRGHDDDEDDHRSRSSRHDEDDDDHRVLGCADVLGDSPCCTGLAGAAG